MPKKVNPKTIDKIIKKHRAEPEMLIPMLQDVQAEYNYLPRPALLRIQTSLGLPLTRIYEVATFYKAFSLEPRGDYICQVCLGTACHLRGGHRIVDAFERELKVNVGDTTKDGKFTLETVHCLGACALAPLVRVNDQYHSTMSPDRVKRLIKKYRNGTKGKTGKN
jgi:NADH:ubiquinone oxidoreductase subunit E